MRDKLVVAAVLLAVAATLGLAAIMLLAAGVRRLRGRGKSLSGPFRVFRAVVMSLTAIIMICLAYARLVEPNWLSIVRVTVPCDKLAPGSVPIRLVHISDLHCEPAARLEDQVVSAIADLRPDLIFFTGDCVNTPAGLPVFRHTMTALAKLAPTFAVRGNWDVYHHAGLDFFGGTGVTELDGEADRIAVRGADIYILGQQVDGGCRWEDLVKLVPPGAPKILLYHYPHLLPEIATLGIDLYLAGHTHGGQVALPWYGALVTLAKTGKRYEAGLYHEGRSYLYVNRGIGMEGGISPRVRFFARPEVTLIELAPAK
jgi:uncharacterized protein